MTISTLRPALATGLIAGALTLTLVEPALAQTANIEGVLQKVVDMLTGEVARLLAIIAVIVVGIAWMFGYLDAGTGSMIAAAVAGGAAGVGVLLRMYGNRFLGVFSKKRRVQAEQDREALLGASSADDA